MPRQARVPLIKMAFFTSTLITLCVTLLTTNIQSRILHCPFSGSGILDNSTEAYELTYVVLGERLEFPCCQRYFTPAKNTWFIRSRSFRDDEASIENYHSFYWSSNETWIVPAAKAESSKVYYCKRGITPTPDYNTFVYMINVEYPNKTILHGRLASFLVYKRQYIEPVSNLLNQLQDTLLNNFLSKSGLGLYLGLRWSEWSDCDTCKEVETRYGRCHISAHIHDQQRCSELGQLCKLYKESLHMDCSMFWLVNEISPTWASNVKSIPDFNVSVSCSGPCSTKVTPGIDVRRKLITRRISVGDSIAMSCPHYNISRLCRWSWNGIKLSTDVYEPYKKVTVNEFCILFLRDVSTSEKGNFSCFLDDELQIQNIVHVEEVQEEKNAAWWRHMKYLLFIIVLCFIVLVGGVAVAYIQRESFIQIDPEDVLEKYAAEKFEFEKLLPQEN